MSFYRNIAHNGDIIISNLSREITNEFMNRFKERCTSEYSYTYDDFRIHSYISSNNEVLYNVKEDIRDFVIDYCNHRIKRDDYFEDVRSLVHENIIASLNRMDILNISPDSYVNLHINIWFKQHTRLKRYNVALSVSNDFIQDVIRLY